MKKEIIDKFNKNTNNKNANNYKNKKELHL